MSSWIDSAEQILYGKSLEDKLCAIESFESIDFKLHQYPKLPGRDKRLQFSEKKQKFPGKGSLIEDEKKAIAFHFFANHELLALEMMAAALLVYPHDSEEGVRFKKDLIATMKDEQKHMRLYIIRMKELGIEFGDFPLNDFFWRQTPNLKTPEQFYALMALTFESANLDFASYYAEVFREMGDEKSVQTMNIVLEDEIVHVARGARWMDRVNGGKDLWSFYMDNLPPLLTPCRAKGILYKPELRLRCGLSDDFVEKLSNYQDDYRITQRKTWKATP
tara:strand:+ start:875 stop:1702 length:828 start_codon:yes stop_codon:yes gene_type:complete